MTARFGESYIYICAAKLSDIDYPILTPVLRHFIADWRRRGELLPVGGGEIIYIPEVTTLTRWCGTEYYEKRYLPPIGAVSGSEQLAMLNAMINVPGCKTPDEGTLRAFLERNLMRFSIEPRFPLDLNIKFLECNNHGRPIRTKDNTTNYMGHIRPRVFLSAPGTNKTLNEAVVYSKCWWEPGNTEYFGWLLTKDNDEWRVDDCIFRQAY